ncbi:unnamed protein product, partial [Effrenium voratum]
DCESCKQFDAQYSEDETLPVRDIDNKWSSMPSWRCSVRFRAWAGSPRPTSCTLAVFGVDGRQRDGPDLLQSGYREVAFESLQGS